jgi:uncharacterized protein
MTPQESELVDELFNRLAKLETAQRDPEAARLIADGLRRAPHAVYALVQTVLLQDEALKRANARIEELQVHTSAAVEPEQPPTSFLDSMREALSGRAPHGSVPSVRTAGGNQQPQPGYPQQTPFSRYPGAPSIGSGGSFLGTAASTAAGAIGGSLLLGGIRSMFGPHLGGTYADREQDRLQDLADDRQQELADADREQDSQQDLADDRQQELADADREQDAEQDLADEDAQQDSEQDQTDDDDFASGDDFSDDGYDA